MESASRRMEASGVFSSWLASETKRRRTSSVVWRRSVRLLNSSASWAISSRPTGWRRWPYSPSPTTRMAPSKAAMRAVSILEKKVDITRVTRAITREMVRRFCCKLYSRAPCTRSTSRI